MFEIADNPYIKYPYVRDSKVEINHDENRYDKNSNQNISSSESDLYEVVLHEIGHSIGLQNIESNYKDDDKVMYHSVKQGKKEDNVIDATDALGATVIGIESRAINTDSNLASNACKNDYSLNNNPVCETGALNVKKSVYYLTLLLLEVNLQFYPIPVKR